MKRIMLCLAAVLLAAFALSSARAVAAPTCTQTGFMRDGTNLTAALIDPLGTFSGDVDATGCNIGIFYGAGASGELFGASVHGANYFGVVRYGASVTITNSVVYQIGDQPFDGSQHGVAIYCADDSPQASPGNIVNNLVYAYQKGGIEVNGSNCSATVENNSVIGNGVIDYIAQNGIEAGDGSRVSILNNYVFGNSYTGPDEASSGGILVFGGACFGVTNYETNTQVLDNTAIGNDVGVYSLNLQADCETVPSSSTNNSIDSNILKNNADNNTTGDGPTTGYQAGIDDSGNGDRIMDNQICGIGYASMTSPTLVTTPIDTTDTKNAAVGGNISCGPGLYGPTARAITPTPHGHQHASVNK
jgi:hypothetical protein